MGWKWEVQSLQRLDTRYDWLVVYTGNSFLMMVIKALHARTERTGSVRVVWRP